jgi:hypothetical protein
MTEKLLFDVHVKRATPACDENCPNLHILDEHEKLWSNMQAIVTSTYRCANETYCKNLWKHMKEVNK